LQALVCKTRGGTCQGIVSCAWHSHGLLQGKAVQLEQPGTKDGVLFEQPSEPEKWDDGVEDIFGYNYACEADWRWLPRWKLGSTLVG